MVWPLIMAFLAAGCVAAAPEAPPVTLALVDHAGLEAEIARHRGKVVVLDCWSTSCPPCVKEFPRLVALERTFAGDVVCLSLSFDYEGIGSPDDAVPRVKQFLEQVGAGRIVNLLGRDDSDTLHAKLDLVSIPAVYVYNPDGTLAQRFDEEDARRRFGRPFTYDDIEAAVRTLLKR